MDTAIEYNAQKVLTDSVYVKDVGNCALEAVSEVGEYYYLIIQTEDGVSNVCTFGPVVPDIIELPRVYSATIVRQGYNDEKLAKAIQTWATPKKTNFIEIKQVSVEDAMKEYRDIADYIGGSYE